MANIPLQSITFPGLSDKYTTPTVDATLTQTGAAADAKKTGDEIGAIKNDLSEKADKSEALSAYIVETETGAIASFTDGADDVPVKDLLVAIEPVQSGSGDPSPENVRPISGWTGANVTRTGKNLVNIPTCTIAQAGTAYPISPLPQALHAGTYTVGITSSAEAAWSVGFRDASGNIVDSFASNRALAGRQTKTATLSATVTKVSIYVNAGTTLSDIMFEFGSTASAYEPFVDSDTVSIDWTTEASTVYGGTLDVTTGVLTVDRAMVDLGDKNWSLFGNTENRQAWVAYFSEIKPPVNGSTPYDAISSEFKGVSYNASWLPGVFAPTASSSATGVAFCVESGKYASASEFKTAMNGVQLVYELATPQTYQLTPQEVSTILGQNNIFADCGDVTVQYRADTKLYIDKVLNA